jgi:GNAT superfamily N-acetyltransferase
MSIHLATTDAEIMDCYPVMQALRPHIAEQQFLSTVRRQEQTGYRLAFVKARVGVVAVSGFRIGENLAWGRFLYVDDLVTAPGQRSRGHGGGLLSWLEELAAREGCGQLHLDSGIQRTDAHRFYERAGMTMTSLHFVADTVPDPAHRPTSRGDAAGTRNRTAPED